MKLEMKSEIWRVVTQRIGQIESFKSEREMQAFLMNNPAIVGCWDPGSKGDLPTLVREEVFSRGEEGLKGRMDIVGVAKKEEGGYELRVFELKLGEIDSAAVIQLKNYLSAWKNEIGANKEIKKWILGLDLQGIDDSNIDDIIKNPVGVLVGSKFAPEAIRDALASDIKGIRLARFRGGAKSEHEYYIIIEDQVGRTVGGQKRYWSWNELINAGLIHEDDIFVIAHKDYELRGKPDPNYLKYNWIRIIFDEKSRKTLLEKENEIKQMASADANAKKWIDSDFQSLRKAEGVWLSHATAFSYFAFGGPTASYWVPTYYWRHEKSGKLLSELVKKLKK